MTRSRDEILRVVGDQTIELARGLAPPDSYTPYHQGPDVTCPDCTDKAPALAGYRCFHCGIIFCETCAPGHFGEPQEAAGHAVRLVGPSRQTERYRLFPSFHDRLEVASVAAWVEPRSDGHVEEGFVDLCPQDPAIAPATGSDVDEPVAKEM